MDFRVYEIVILFWRLQRGPVGRPPALSEYDRNVLVLSKRACPFYGWRFGRCRTRGGVKKVFKRASLLPSAKPSSSLQFSLSPSRPYAPNTLLSASPPPSPVFPVPAFASVKTKTYLRAGTDATVLLRATSYHFFAFCPSDASHVGA